MDELRVPAARRPTMGDVAAHAGVSPKTVSRVVNGEEPVSADLAARVRAAITDLGYRPDRRARDLAGTRPGHLVGYVQTDAGNPFFSAVHRGVEDVVGGAGLLVISGSTDADPLREAELVTTLVESRVGGVVVAGAEGSDATLRREVAAGTPVVCVDRVVPGCDSVVSSNRDSSREAVGELLAVGHRRIAFLGGDPAVWTVQERRHGYTAAHTDAGRSPTDGLVVLDVGDTDRAEAATRRLLNLRWPPTALFAAQDRITAGVIRALHALGRQHAVALYGFDDIPFAAELQPAVSVVRQDPYVMGRRAGELLLDRLTVTGSGAPVRRIEVPAARCPRASSAIPPG